MASPAIPTPGSGARSRLCSTSPAPRTGRDAAAGLLLALVLLLVLLGTMWGNVARLSSDQDDLSRSASRGLDTADAPTADGLVARRADGLQAVRAVVRQDRGGSLVDPTPSPAQAPQAGQGDLPHAGRADAASATRTTRSNLVVAGLIGSLLAAGAATGTRRSSAAEVGGIATGAAVPTATGDPLLVTTSFAQQTDLLALDAAIVAARAREEGKRLVPVAREVEEPAWETATVTEDVPRCVQAVPAHRGAAVATSMPVATSTPVATLVRTTAFAAGRSRASGPTTALWHAVELPRPSAGIGGPCQIAVCGTLVRVGPEQGWPVAARDVCPACATLAR